MNFMIIDLVILGLFLIFTTSFLYRKRKEIKREGLLFLYRTSWGIKAIDKYSKKHPRTLNFMSWVAVILGYLLMIAMLYLFFRILYIYIFQSEIVRAVKVPPIMPLVPYLPQMFSLNFLPPFYFSYWIIVLLIVAVSHEFFHGIFAGHAKVKTKTTGFGFFPFFFPVFLAAFVELDEKTMVTRSNFKQRAVLAAGTFANILIALLGFVLMFSFFSLTFNASGIIYDDYAYNVVNIDNINYVDGMPFQKENLVSLSYSNGLKEIKVGSQNYSALKAYSSSNNLAILYYDSPAIKNNLTGAILSIEGNKIYSIDSLSSELKKYSIGDTIKIETFDGKNKQIKEIILEENPNNPGSVWLGISFRDQTPKGFLAKFSYVFTSYKSPNVYYVPNFEAAQYIYDLLWWLVLISFSVALVNMLPMGIFDGGRFFYLTVLAITKNKSKAEKSFKYLTKFLLILLLIVMFFWAKNIF